MFTAVGLFRDVTCPEQPHCMLPNCIFAHKNTRSAPTEKEQMSGSLSTGGLYRSVEDTPSQGSRKRRRIDAENQAVEASHTQAGVNSAKQQTSKSPATALRAISPPPFRSASKTCNVVDSTHRRGFEEPLSLNPRMLSNPPAPHSTRVELVRMLHDHLSRLNEEVKTSNDVAKQALALSRDELILQALDEEEKTAKDKPSVYANLLKLRIVKLKKMKLADWKKERLVQIADKSTQNPYAHQLPALKTIETGLDSKQEIAFLPKLLAKMEGLDKHGYINRKPTEDELKKAREGVEAAQGWEQCDRCQTRFQVFPGRRAGDGASTSGGLCNYHPAKPRRPTAIDNADKISKESMYSCCKENVGVSAGCTTATSHVFKVSNPVRLDMITPFKDTPINAQLIKGHAAICFDCEMGYTTCGLELIRLTAVSWSSGDAVVDVLVRPVGEVLDLNSRFSGVWPIDFANAVPHGADSLSDSKVHVENKLTSRSLAMVESPGAARELLLSYLSPSTPLIGHALENDLNAARLIHPSIIDTALLFPHPRGLPIRFGLKMLMKKHLDRDIQMGDGSAGHDSKEDAKAAGELVRCKMLDMWGKLKRDGWKVEGEDFIPPMTRAEVMKAEIS